MTFIFIQKVNSFFVAGAENYFSDESLPAFFFIIALHWSGGDSSGKKDPDGREKII
jgi:hypothetical protein